MLLSACGLFSHSEPRPLTPAQTAIVNAVRSPSENSGLAEAVRANGGDVNFRVPGSGRTPLMLAVIQHDRERFNLLLEAGADTAETDLRGMTALHYAAELDGDAFLDRLLREKNAPDPRDKFDKTPLMDACRLGNLKTVQRLLEAGADPGATDRRGRSVFMFASGARVNSIPLLQMLEARGTQIGTIDKSAQTTLTAAIDAGNTDTAFFLLRRFPENIAADPVAAFAGLLAMKHAVYANNLPVAKELVRRKLPLNTEISDALKALKTVELKNIFYSLADTGAIKDGKSPLFWAAEKDHAEIIAMLLAAGANPLCPDHTGNYPIDYTRARQTHQMLLKAMEKVKAAEQGR